MPQTQYNLHLKGFVGGADFDRNYVDYVLAKNAGKDVNVLIDSLGGNLATANNIPPQRNIIAFDDFVTTRQTLVAMQNLLV